MKKSIMIGLSCLVMFSFSALTIYAEKTEQLYRITISSYADARLVNSSGVRAILGENNEYLVSGGAESIEKIRAAGIRSDLLYHEFNPDDWVIISSENPEIELAIRTMSLGMADWIVTGSQILIRKTDIPKVGFGNELWTLPLPSGDIPIRYYPETYFTAPPVELDLIDSLVSLVSADSIESYVKNLEAFQTRYSLTDSVISARDWIISKFNSFGMEVSIDSFLHNTGNVPYGDYGYNVVADYVGTSAPDVYIVLGAHYDCISNNPFVHAPGADDNASGTAFCIEIARVLQQFETPKTIRFVCFEFEEQGLIGSYRYVDSHVDQNIEVMINADMIGSNLSTNSTVKIYNTLASKPYAEFISTQIGRHSELIGNTNVGNSGRSDHAPFQRYWPAVFIHEQNFSTHYHSVSDSASYLDFNYMKDIIRGAAAATYQIATAPPNVENVVVTDPGKGDRLLVEWDEPDDSRDLEYKILIGTESGHYTDYQIVHKGISSAELTGLTEGVEYFIAVSAVIDDTLFSILRFEDSGIPVSMPYAPDTLFAIPRLRSIQLNWPPSIHPDVVSYHIFRSVADMDDFSLIAETSDTSLTDELILNENYYDYYVIAVDEDSNQSAPGDTVTSIGLFFNRNLLAVLERDWRLDTSVAYSRFQSMLSDIPNDEVIVPFAQSSGLSIEDFGQYRSVFWIADGVYTSVPIRNELKQFKEYGGNILLMGPMIAGKLESDDSFLGSLGYTMSTDTNFVSGLGIEGWPNAIPDQTIEAYWNLGGISQYLVNVPVLEPDPGIASQIYLYQAFDMDTVFHNKPCGIYAEIGDSKLAYLSFPLVNLTVESGRNILNHAADMFGITRNGAGDIDDDTHYTLLDAVLMISMLYSSAPMPDDLNRLDVNADCIFDLKDVIYLLTYIYADGDPPGYGCVESE